jgi:AraC-like DNA-binding protein
MENTNLLNHVKANFDQVSDSAGPYITPLPDLILIRHFSPTEFESVIYEPIVCLILQGKKETTIHERTIEIGPGESLLISHDVTVSARTTQASKELPYIALVVKIDLGMLRSLYESIESFDKNEDEASSFAFDIIDDDISETLERYLKLTDNPQGAKILGPLILKELHYRLLMAPQGAMLRHLMLRNSHASNIYKAIKIIRENFRQPLAIPEVAKYAGMGISSFHTHFKSITGTTPLQFQKELRLIEAKQILISGRHSVSSAAFEVGYESPTQFSREYKREFGHSPATDLMESDNFDSSVLQAG